MNLSFAIKKCCLDALNAAFPQPQGWDAKTSIEITKTAHDKYGHYQCNSPMRLAKILNIPPKAIAEKLIEHLKGITLFEKIEITDPGFINFTINPQILSELIKAQYGGGGY